MLEKLKTELKAIDEGIEYMELSDTAWHPTYTKLCKMKRIIKKTIKKIERIEKNDKHQNQETQP